MTQSVPGLMQPGLLAPGTPVPPAAATAGTRPVIAPGAATVQAANW